MFDEFASTYTLEAAAQDGESTWLGDLWEGAKDVLEDGVDIYRDFVTIERGIDGNAGGVPYMGNPNARAEMYVPQDRTAANTTLHPAVQPADWVPGVSNNTVLIGAGVLIAAILVARG